MNTTNKTKHLLMGDRRIIMVGPVSSGGADVWMDGCPKKFTAQLLRIHKILLGKPVVVTSCWIFEPDA